MIQTNSLRDFMVQGQQYTLRVRIYDEDGDFYNVGTSTLKLILSKNWAEGDSVLELTGSVVGDSADGRIQFSFQPAHTADLMPMGYDLNVFVDSYPACRGRFGILPRNPEVT